MAPPKAALTAEDGIWEPKRWKVNEVDKGRRSEFVRTFEVVLVPSNIEIEAFFLKSDGKSTVVRTAKSGWRKRVERTQ